MSGIGGRAPRHFPVLADSGRPVQRYHRNGQLLPIHIDYSIGHRLGPMPKSAAELAEAAARRELVVKARHVAAALRREQQRQARIAAGVDRSSPDAGPRPRWSR